MQKKEEEPVTSKKEGGNEKENVGEELACAKEGQAGRNKGLFFVLASIIVINFHVIARLQMPRRRRKRMRWRQPKQR